MSDYSDMVEPPKTIRLCADCQKEQGIDFQTIQNLGWVITHGACLRHLIRYYKSFGYTEEKAKETALRSQQTQKMAGQKNSRDLSLPDNQSLLQWLKSPTPAPQS
jgi:hypothetical protein